MAVAGGESVVAVPVLKSLPVGYRFRPTDEELVNHYLRLKINRCDDKVAVIREVDICKLEPWDLPDLSVVESHDNEWFFFCPIDRKYQNGQRLNRATERGYWKATGKDRNIVTKKGAKIGMKKSLVYYIGRAPEGKRTNWVIHEYRATDKSLDCSHPGQGAFVLCRLFKKNDSKVDENVESSHFDEVERLVSSPAVGKSPINDELPEAIASSQILQPLNVSDKSSPPNISQGISHGMSPGNDCTGDDTEDQMLDITSIPPDPELERALEKFCDPSQEPLDWEFFSQLQSQLQGEFGSSPMTNEMSCDQKDVLFQNGTNALDIDEVFNSVVSSDELSCEDSVPMGSINVLNYDYDYPGEVALSAGSGGMQVPSLLNIEDLSGYGNVGSDSGFGTGIIKLRTRQMQNQPDYEQFGFGMQGTTHRRTRLQVKLHVGTVEHRMPRNEKASSEHSSTGSAAIGSDEAQDTKCKEFKGDGLVTEHLTANMKDTDDFSKFRTRTLNSPSFCLYIPRVLIVLSLLVVFFGIWGCFKST